MPDLPVLRAELLAAAERVLRAEGVLPRDVCLTGIVCVAKPERGDELSTFGCLTFRPLPLKDAQAMLAHGVNQANAQAQE